MNPFKDCFQRIICWKNCFREENKDFRERSSSFEGKISEKLFSEFRDRGIVENQGFFQYGAPIAYFDNCGEVREGSFFCSGEDNYYHVSQIKCLFNIVIMICITKIHYFSEYEPDRYHSRSIVD